MHRISSAKQRIPSLLAALLALCAAAPDARAGEVGHYVPGVLAIRDFAMPEPGFYTALYYYTYSTERIDDSHGNEIDGLTLQPGPGPGLDVGLEIDVDIQALTPTLIWVSPWKILGAKYGAFVSPSFADASISAALSIPTGTGRTAEISSFDVADLYAQPLWLDWSLPHWDFALAYGFWAPIGRYDTEEIELPVLGTLEAEATDNIGLGFWTHQIQGAATWYPWQDKRMAVTAALTHEIHGKKRDFDLQPGQNLTLNYGVSQFLPLRKDMKLLLEIGPTGYSSWQLTHDSGSDAARNSVLDSVHAIGGQIGLAVPPWNALIAFRYYHEFHAADRFRGHSLGLNIALGFH